MFMLSWIRSTEAQASKDAPVLAADYDAVEEDQRQEDWVVLPCTTAHAGGSGEQTTKKSRRQLKQELRHKQAMEELERRPRYDPMIAKMRDHEFKMAKMAKLGLRSGRIMSSSSGGPQSAKSTRNAGGSTAA
ncbi:hypothetical protein EC968_007282 [Mortierella alpina]|nr:hypothetical protein EC968_007282 [Mortierella alpina]